jgi:hypothetical protein
LRRLPWLLDQHLWTLNNQRLTTIEANRREHWAAQENKHNKTDRSTCNRTD